VDSNNIASSPLLVKWEQDQPFIIEPTHYTLPVTLELPPIQHSGESIGGCGQSRGGSGGCGENLKTSVKNWKFAGGKKIHVILPLLFS
jgi:hypothetical protein